MKRIIRISFSVALCLLISSQGLASDTINYQGKLMDSDGIPVDTTEGDPIPIIFKYYNNLETISELCSESHEVSVTNGFFSVQLSLGPSCDEFIGQFGDDDGSWVGITVNGEELNPRLEITSAVSVLSVNGAGGGMIGEALTVDEETRYVGIGATEPERELHINSTTGAQIKLQGTTGNWEGLDFQNESYDGYMGMLENDGRFFVDMASDGDDLVVTQGGKVGIGTTNPKQTLEVSGGIKIGNASCSEDTEGTIRYTRDGSGTGHFYGCRWDPATGGVHWERLDN